MTKPKFTFMELPISQVARDPNQPRKDFGAEGEKNKLKLSIKNYGIEEPIKVSGVSPKRYIIIDGHRRYICAQKLNMKYVPSRLVATKCKTIVARGIRLNVPKHWSESSIRTDSRTTTSLPTISA